MQKGKLEEMEEQELERRRCFRTSVNDICSEAASGTAKVLVPELGKNSEGARDSRLLW
jgi:hypothetical protein